MDARHTVGIWLASQEMVRSRLAPPKAAFAAGAILVIDDPRNQRPRDRWISAAPASHPVPASGIGIEPDAPVLDKLAGHAP
jgi:hypothetical protein